METLTFPKEWRSLFQDACVPSEILEDLQSARSIVRLVSDTLSAQTSHNSSLRLSLEKLNSEQNNRTSKNSPEMEKRETCLDSDPSIFDDHVHVVEKKLPTKSGAVTVGNSSDHKSYDVGESDDNYSTGMNGETVRITQRTELSDTDSSDLVTLTDSIELSLEKVSDLEISELDSTSSEELSLIDSLEDFDEKHETHSTVSEVMESARQSRVAWNDDVEVEDSGRYNVDVVSDHISNVGTTNCQPQPCAFPLYEDQNSFKNSNGRARKDHVEKQTQLHIQHTKNMSEDRAVISAVSAITPDLLSVGIQKLKLLPGNNAKTLCKSPTMKNSASAKKNTSFVVKSIDLQNCKQHLRAITNPHPSQLADLKCVREETLSSIAEIIKKVSNFFLIHTV